MINVITFAVRKSDGNRTLPNDGMKRTSERTKLYISTGL